MLIEADETISKTIKDTDREASRLDTLVQGQYRKLNTDAKKGYDALKLIATLHPTAAHPPARRKLIEELLEQINQTGLILPDGSGRHVRIELGKKEGIELATQNTGNSQN